MFSLPIPDKATVEFIESQADRRRGGVSGYLRELVERDRANVCLSRFKLSPCPFCGGEGILHDEVGPKDWTVCCATCDGHASLFETASEAATAWNRRHMIPSERALAVARELWNANLMDKGDIAEAAEIIAGSPMTPPAQAPPQAMPAPELAPAPAQAHREGRGA